MTLKVHRSDGQHDGPATRDGEEPVVQAPLVLSSTRRPGGRRARVGPLSEEAWREALDRTPDHFPTQTPQWQQCLEAATPWRASGRLYELPGGRFLALPMVSRGVGRAQVSAAWPHGWGYGGVLASDGVVTPEDLSIVGEDLAASPGLRTLVAPSPFTTTDVVFPAARLQHRNLTHSLDVSRGMEAVWRGYSANVRRSVRRAERGGVEVRRDTTGAALPDFARMYRLSSIRWARRAGRPGVLGSLQARLTEPPSVLPAVSAVLGDDLVTWTAYVDGQAAAAVVILHGAGHSLMWRGAQDQELAACTHANTLVQHRAIEAAIARGDHTYSFGESEPGSSLATYKAKFGAVGLEWSSASFERLPVSTAGEGVRRAYRTVSSLPSRVRLGGATR